MFVTWESDILCEIYTEKKMFEGANGKKEI